MGEDRGRPINRANSDGLSSFYRERFGSHSPEEYLNLRISGIDERLERDEIKMKLTHEFRRFAPFEIKVVRNPEEDERMAYVNFERRDCARNIRYKMMDRLREALGKRVLCDPAGILRDQEGKYIPDRFNRSLQTDRSSRDRKGPKEPPQWRLKNDDSDATRTLFVGNMPADVRETEIRKVFEKYGKIEDIDIKTPVNTDAAYAFVMFQSLEQAMDAKAEEQDRPIRPGSSRVKIGYGKSQVSRRLWVGGLGSWCSADMLAKEFDRYGMIEKLDYNEGDDVAYICFEDTHAAQDACRAMRNYPLGGRDRSIMVDFAKDVLASRDSGRKRRASRSPSSPVAIRSPPGSPRASVRTFEDLDEEYASTWQGQLFLKKNDYPVKLYRVYGAERLLQKLLRDDDGNPLKVQISQRLSLQNQDALQEKFLNHSSKEMCLMVITAKRELDDLRPLIRYLDEKDAAGVVSIKDGVFYVIPHSGMVERVVAAKAPGVRLFSGDCPFLLGVLCNSSARSHSGD
ncbi:unnamed protein product [Caenorhabditis auriculariae]|uniref:SPOC domain protein n=1 Tax=Caenorhabditis auriculariae TaxID=2777116 RepID=A0A8S1HGS1_9PELO|nr:unnamed protein product [Caenorhabditis auriculariae]